jgi:NAD(P)-dependent dehydrogenase (short-subunit alcohol dehydrogenase family)
MPPPRARVEVLARVLAAELGPKRIRVNCVIPGAVPTEINLRAGLFTEAEHKTRMEALAPMHALGRIGTDLEIAEAIEYLITAEWTTGASLVVGRRPFARRFESLRRPAWLQQLDSSAKRKRCVARR